jgi:hypothetical protein
MIREMPWAGVHAEPTALLLFLNGSRQTAKGGSFPRRLAWCPESEARSQTRLMRPRIASAPAVQANGRESLLCPAGRAGASRQSKVGLSS